MNSIAKWLSCIVCAMGAALPVVAAEPNYPERAISIVVPFTAGNANDAWARTVATRLNERLKQPVVVENRPGAGGTIGAAHVARAKPDGYTLLVNSTTMSTSQLTFKTPGYDIVKDFAPVGLLAYAPMGIFVNGSLPVNSLAEFIAYAKRNPGKINFGSSGSGSIMHLNAERVNLETGMGALHIPYSGGAPAVQALMANDIHFLVIDVASGLPGIQSGRLKLLAIGASTRLPALPNVPTTREAGLSFDPSLWYGIFAPAGTPPEVLKVLRREVNQIVTESPYRAALEARSSNLPPTTIEQFQSALVKEISNYREAIVKAKIKIE
ncbi:MAG: tripartite tricarboxylate transporter substrate binding protein [Pseudomonadota bacterium]